MRRALWVVGLSVALFSSPAIPQPKVPADQERRAKELFADAEAYYRLQYYERALELYREAYLLARVPAMLYNIGQCYRQLGRYEEALKSYRAYLSDSPNTPIREVVEILIAESESNLAAIRSAAVPAALPAPIPREVEPVTEPATEPASEPASEPATEPASYPATAPAAALGPERRRVAPEVKIAEGAAAFYTGAAVAGGLGLTAGGLGVLAAMRSQRDLPPAPGGGVDGVGRAAQWAQGLGTVSDVLLAAALFGGGVGYWLDPRPAVPRVCYGAAAGAAGLGVVAGISALSAGARSRSAPDLGEIEFYRDRMRGHTRAMGVYLSAAVISGGVGYLLSRLQRAPAGGASP
jgi:hypothetical protein